MRSKLSAVSKFANAVRIVINTNMCVSVANSSGPDDNTVAVDIALGEHKKNGDAESNNNITLFLERFQISPWEDQYLMQCNSNKLLTNPVAQAQDQQQLE